MPIYEYQCQKCHKVFEIFIANIQASPGEINCPDCASFQVKKRISLTASTEWADFLDKMEQKVKGKSD